MLPYKGQDWPGLIEIGTKRHKTLSFEVRRWDPSIGLPENLKINGIDSETEPIPDKYGLPLPVIMQNAYMTGKYNGVVDQHRSL